MRILTALLITLLVITSATVSAQEEPQLVEIVAGETTLVADYYAGAADSPTLLLLHMLDSNRSAWEPLIPALLDAGYGVLAPDLRGHGKSQGPRDWEAAVQDITAWIDWLASQNDGEQQVAIVGASIGGTLAILGCSNNAACVTVIALSPPFESRGLSIQEALEVGLAEKSVLIIASHDDDGFADDARRVLEVATGEASVHLYSGSLHGTSMFILRQLGADITQNIMTWLGDHFENLP